MDTKKFILVLLIIGLFYGLILALSKSNGSFRFWDNSNITTTPIASTSYYVFFLENGQVYFGNILSKDTNEIVVINPYFLSQGKEPILMKTVNQVYGPKDEMYIGRNKIIFYQELRSDSSIVKSIQESLKK